MKDDFIIYKNFEPLDDLFLLLKHLQEYFEVEIEEEHFVIGKKQIFFTFFHELLHAFIRRKAEWVFKLSEDEIDFIDEVMVRFLLDDLLRSNTLFKKVDDYYTDFVRHRYDLKNYGYNLKPKDYDKLYEYYLSHYSENKDIEKACLYIKEKMVELKVEREKDFSYRREKK